MAPILRKPWPLPCLVMLVLGSAGVWRPGLWADELATWGAITEPWPGLWELLSHTDAVNGGYYVVMKVWASVFGTGEVALRLPSIAAMTLTAGLTAAIGARLWTPRWGVLAGLVFAVLPMTSRYAAEARGYAFAMAFGALATLLLVRQCHAGDSGRRTRNWIYYVLSIIGVGVFHLVAVLLLVGHASLVALLDRRQLRHWLPTAALALVTLAPLALLGATQIGQTDWIRPLSPWGLAAVSKDLFESRWNAAVVAGLMIVALWRARDRRTLAVAALGLTPVAALMLVALFVDMWVPRYLLFAVPAWALLAARALAAAPATVPGRQPRFRVAAVALLTAVTISGAGAHYDIRRTSGHAHDTLGAAAVIATGHRAGDGFAVALDEPVVGWEARDLVARYVPAQSRPDDVFATAEQRTDGRLLATECTDLAACLGDTPRLWIVRYENPDDPLDDLGAAKERLLRREFTVARVWPLRGLTVALLIRR